MCEHCDSQFTLKYNLDIHMKSKHVEELLHFACPVKKCDVTCTTPYNLVKHVKDKHPRRRNFTLNAAKKEFVQMKGNFLEIDFLEIFV